MRAALPILLLASTLLATAAPKPLFKSPVVDENTAGHAVSIEVALPRDAKTLYLLVTDGGDGFACDWADWIDPRFVKADGAAVKLTSLKWKKATADWGAVRMQQNAGGGELRVNGLSVSDGIGTHANSLIAFDIPEGSVRFTARGGLDNGGTDQGGAASVQFHVYTEEPTEFVKSLSQSTAGGGSHDPGEAVAGLDVHEALEATLFASEPMILSPSAIDIDHRGRVWVCEVVNYRGHKGKRPEGDRILIVEDTDGDNAADKSTVFYQGPDVDSAHGICVLGNRVIVSAGDDVFSLYDDDGDDQADRKELLFTKIGGAQHDHGIHAFHFGPDGKLYFNFGNSGRQLCDKDGNIITDLAGNEVRTNRQPYQEGMIFRCDLDGSNVESLAWNFRNNWEVAVDSFGRLWQSDNDDDGNRAVRINYVLPFGNYGFRDEITGAGWNDPRPGIEEDIPSRHWHLNDPGVVPNLLLTGAGSPTGICFYEGALLPKEFHGQPIHCDAGPNIVRAYPVTEDGAGFSATELPILTGTRDRWFRPSDVCVAPDGSLLVADWYDPGVGGHGMGDLDRGRLFLVAPAGHQYAAPKPDLETSGGVLAALASPNEAARYLAYDALQRMPRAVSENLLGELFAARAKPLHLRARAFWAAVTLNPNPAPIIEHAFRSDEPLLRACAVRAWRIIDPKGDHDEFLQRAASDVDVQVRVETAIALRFSERSSSDTAWAKLAANYKGNDRWFLEALGIGADLYWPSRFAAYLKETGDKPHPDLVWRARCEDALPYLARLIANADDSAERNRYVRALHFQPSTDAQTILDLFRKSAPEVAALLALEELDRQTIEQAGEMNRVESLALARKDSSDLVRLATRYNLQSEAILPALLDFIVAHRNEQDAADAARHLLGKPDVVDNSLRDGSPDVRQALATALGRSGDKRAIDHLAATLQRAGDPESRRTCVEALALTRPGEDKLLALAQAGELPADVKFTTAALLGRSREAAIRDGVAKALDLPPAPGTESLPPLPELLRMNGNVPRGKSAFTKATCATCHQVHGEGLNYGPDLSEIGGKLPREALYEAILYPSNAIAHGYAGVQIDTKSGDQVVGFLTSETDQKITVRMAGGLTRDLAPAEIKSRKDLDQSLMPPGLAALLTPQDLADLVSYLESLKK